jgi:hypothetical protein
MGGDDGERCFKDHRRKSIYEHFNLKKLLAAGSVFLTAVLLRIQVLLDVTP